MVTKICTSCRIEKVKSNEYFSKRSTAKDGLQGICKMCAEEYRTKNKQKAKDRCNARKELISAYHKIYSMEHKADKAKTRRKSYELNKEKEKKANKLYNENNKERVAFSRKEWARNNKDKTCIARQNYRTKKKNLPHTLTNKAWLNIKSSFNNRCCYCDRELPLAQEHFLALSKNGEYTINNILPSCQSCNSSKSNKSFEVWYPRYKYYSEKREIKILKFLNYKNGQQQLKII